MAAHMVMKAQVLEVFAFFAFCLQDTFPLSSECGDYYGWLV